MSSLAPDPWTPKYKELYDLAKESFSEELARLVRIDSKASNYLSVITLILGIYAFFSRYGLEKCLPVSSLESFLMILSLSLLGLSLLCTWYVVFRVIKIQAYHKIPVEPEFFKKNALASVYYSMATGMKENMLLNRKIGEKKALRLTAAYWLILIDVFLLLCTAASYAYHFVNNPVVAKCGCHS